ncbi:MAG: hypothetical protein QG656_854 [Candidatus Hydrogenedentes bacterium]|nr:hypothetical protein [Candidatus Hydrogenedentota bacterium]
MEKGGTVCKPAAGLAFHFTSIEFVSRSVFFAGLAPAPLDVYAERGFILVHAEEVVRKGTRNDDKDCD